MPAEEVWRRYRPRANEENAIKERKEGYGWHEFNGRSFWGPEAAMWLIGMVYTTTWSITSTAGS